MVKINLLPVRATAQRESLRAQAVIAAMLLVVMLLIIGYLHMSISGKIEGLNESVNRTQKELDRLNKIMAEVDKFKADSKTLKKKLDVIKKLNMGRTDAVKLMDELSIVAPEKLWFLSLSMGASSLTLTGLSLDHDTIASFMRNMEKSDYFNSIKLKSTAQKKMVGENVHQFALTVVYQPPEPKNKEK